MVKMKMKFNFLQRYEDIEKRDLYLNGLKN